MSKTMNTAWDRVRAALADADSITWDGCHKIYVAMDAQQTEEMAEIGYDPILKVTDVDDAFETLKDWYARSCGLEFISAIKTVAGDPNDKFTNLISQFEGEED
jgi:hypothetical protein